MPKAPRGEWRSRPPRASGLPLELPRGVEKLAQLDYTAGKLRLEELGGGEGMLALYWSFGQMVDPGAALEIGRTEARSDGLDPQGAKLLDGKPGGATLVAIDADGTKLQAFFQCGARTMSVATFKVSESAVRKILESIKCTPDTAKEKGATSIPIAIDFLATPRSSAPRAPWP